MYASKKFVELPSEIELPKGMYNVNPLYTFDEMSSQLYRPQNPQPQRNFGNSPMTSFTNLEKRQCEILKKLDEFNNKLKALMGNKLKCSSKFDDPTEEINYNAIRYKLVVHVIVIACNTSHPPYSILLLKKMLRNRGISVHSSSHHHSSLDQVNEKLSNIFLDDRTPRSIAAVSFCIQWKDQPMTSLMVNPLCQSAIHGEGNLIRYISRLFPASSSFNYESKESFSAISETDFWMDALQNQLLEGTNQQRQALLKLLNSRLGRAAWLDGENYGMPDVFAWSLLLQLNLDKRLPSNVDAWFKKINSFFCLPNFNSNS